nr:Hornerin like [Ipomoea batatas]
MAKKQNNLNDEIKQLELAEVHDVERQEQNGHLEVEVAVVDYSKRAQWLRAAVLGANDGLLSVASLMMGVGAFRSDVKIMILTGIAGLVAGACSMALGEYVSVYAQYDIETAQMKRERGGDGRKRVLLCQNCKIGPRSFSSERLSIVPKTQAPEHRLGFWECVEILPKTLEICLKISMAPTNHQGNKPSSGQPLYPPPFPSHHSTRKRLLDGSPSNSTSFESSSLDQLPKRITRDLPNLSDCHGCRTRVNHTNPKDRLQTLDSYWRIVLLCRKCIKFVSSAQICSYCFKETVNLDCFTCGRCKRCIHKDCVLRYDHSSPWSYSCKERGPELEFSVCIDCWVPKSLKNSKVCRSIDKSLSKPLSTGTDPKVSLNDNDANSLQKFTTDANAEAKKKNLVSTKEKEKGLREVVAAKSVMDMTKNAMGLAANNESNGDVNDLHLTNTDNFPVPKAMDWKSLISKPVELGKTPQYGEGEKIVVYRRTRLREKISASMSEASVCARDNEIGSSIDLCQTDAKLIAISGASVYAKDKGTCYFDFGRIEHKVKTYKRTRFKRKELHVNDRDDFFVSVVEKCNFGGGSRVVSESQSCQHNDLTQEAHQCELRIPFPVKCDGDVTLQTERCNAKEGRYLLKYSRRCVVSKPGLDHETSMHGDASTRELHLYEVIIPCLVNCDGKVTLQNKSCHEKDDRYSLKYSKRRRIGPIPEFQTKAAVCQATIPCLVKSEGKVNLQNENCNTKEGRYLIKYSKRRTGSKLELDHESNIHNDALHLPESDPGLPRNHFVESRTSSSASMISSVASVQACACINVSSTKDL